MTAVTSGAPPSSIASRTRGARRGQTGQSKRRRTASRVNNAAGEETTARSRLAVETVTPSPAGSPAAAAVRKPSVLSADMARRSDVDLVGSNLIGAMRSVADSNDKKAGIRAATTLPTGVVDLDYDTTCSPLCQQRAMLDASIRDDHCSDSAWAEIFLLQYGREFYDSLREIESKGPYSSTVDVNLGAAENRSYAIGPIIQSFVCYDFKPATIHLAVALADRYLACVDGGAPLQQQDPAGVIMNAADLKCVGCACMMIASKLEEVKHPTAAMFTYTCGAGAIKDMEENICAALHYRLSLVTPHHFLHRFLRASNASSFASALPCGYPSGRGVGGIGGVTSCCHAPAILPPPDNETLEQMSLYLLELSALRCDLVAAKPSLIAASAVYLARATLGVRDRPAAINGRDKVGTCFPSTAARGNWNETLRHYTGYTALDMEETVRKIHDSQISAEEDSLFSGRVFAKYKGGVHRKVSLKTVLRADDLGYATQ